MYSPFYKTLPKSSLKIHWISVRFYEMGVTIKKLQFLAFGSHTAGVMKTVPSVLTFLIFTIPQYTGSLLGSVHKKHTVAQEATGRSITCQLLYW